MRGFPSRVDLELTNSCSLDCVQCPRQFMTRPVGFMKFNLVEKVVKEIKEKKSIHGFDHVAVHQMGEPLLHPQVLEVIKLIVDSGLVCELTTSGLFLNADIAKSLLEISIPLITISLDSIDEKQYEEIRRGSNLHAVLSNIDRLLELRDKTRAKTHIDLVTVEMFNTVGQADAIEARYGERIRVLGGRTVSKKFSQWGGSIKGLASDESTEPGEPCVQMNISEVIQWNGDVSICCLDYDGKTTVGNAYEETLEEIWNGDRFATIRKRIMEGDETIPHCGTCHHLWPKVQEVAE